MDDEKSRKDEAVVHLLEKCPKEQAEKVLRVIFGCLQSIKSFCGIINSFCVYFCSFFMR